MTRILALAGGVGGAKLAAGLAEVCAPGDLTVAVNTGDDFEHLGLHVAPDLDTVMYTLAGMNDRVQGWGIQGESWTFLAALERMGGETWFRLGDQDLATHLTRTPRLRAGESLSSVTADLCARLGIRQAVVPVTDDRLRTMVDSSEGLLAFQDYFVRRRCAPAVRGLSYDGAAAARPSAGLVAALDDPDLAAIVVCPSNPFLSLAPMLAIPGLRQRLDARRVPLVAVSPLIGGAAVKGPAAKIMGELGMPTTPAGIAGFYGALLDGLVIDHADEGQAVGLAGLPRLVTRTLMKEPADRARLAREVMDFARGLMRFSGCGGRG